MISLCAATTEPFASWTLAFAGGGGHGGELCEQPDRYHSIGFMASSVIDRVTMAAATHISTQVSACLSHQSGPIGRESDGDLHLTFLRLRPSTRVGGCILGVVFCSSQLRGRHRQFL